MTVWTILFHISAVFTVLKDLFEEKNILSLSNGWTIFYFKQLDKKELQLGIVVKLQIHNYI